MPNKTQHSNLTALASWKIDSVRESGRSSESAQNRSDCVCLNVLHKMAESVIIHCRENDRAELVRRIEARFECVSELVWRHPTDDYLVSVTPYNEFESEYDLSEKVGVFARLGASSIASFDFEIRRSRSDEACDVLEDFIRLDCDGLDFLVDDMFRTLSREDLADVDDFLDVYRHGRKAEQCAPCKNDSRVGDS